MVSAVYPTPMVETADEIEKESQAAEEIIAQFLDGELTHSEMLVEFWTHVMRIPQGVTHPIPVGRD